MPARRFFVRGRHDVGERIAIEGSDAHKIVHVLRLRSGDTIDVVDSAAQVFASRLEVEGSRVQTRLLERTAVLDETRELRIDVAQGLPKGAKMDYVVEKLSEIGVHALIPLRSQRVVAADISSAKLERWRRLAQSAAAQSGRLRVMQVDDGLSLDALLARATEYDLVLMPWEALDPRPLAQVLAPMLDGVNSVLILIGPEGGFAHDEARAAEEAGAHAISLGTQILRTETAGLVTAAILRYEWDRKKF